METFYTEGISELFALNFSKLGGEIVANESYESGAMDFTEQLTSIAATQPESFFISSFARDIGPITRQARAIPLQNAVGNPTLFLGTDTWDNEVLVADEDTEVEGKFFLRHTFHRAQMNRQHERLLTFTNLFTGEVPTGGIAVNYDAVKLLFQAIERAGSLAPEAIRDQLIDTDNYIGATRIGSYDENRHPSQKFHYTHRQKRRKAIP